MNRAELDLVTADTVAGEKLVAAKAAYRKNKSAANKRKLDDAKRDLYALRVKWRGLREAVPTVAVKATVDRKLTYKEI